MRVSKFPKHPSPRRLGTSIAVFERSTTRTRTSPRTNKIEEVEAWRHNSKEARAAGDWLLREGFASYNESRRYGGGGGWVDDRYHYGVFCASQAMYQLGGDHWRKFYPATAKVILDNQGAQGAWKAESHYHDSPYGNAYTTALMALTLGTPNQFLPIFQR